MTETITIRQLPELARFTETPINAGEPFDLAIATIRAPIIYFVSEENKHAADAYSYVIGKAAQIETVDDPIQAALQLGYEGIVPLVIDSATSRDLNKKMFSQGPQLGQPLMGQIYIPQPGHQSPALYTVGIAKNGLRELEKSSGLSDVDLATRMQAKRKEILGATVTNDDFRKILRSARQIIAHALGPAGTNISQAMERYILELGIEAKTELIVHPEGVTPLEYAEIAAKEIQEGVIPIHMECAVYFKMGQLFNQRRHEVVFADHHHMLLDEMQTASIVTLEELIKRGPVRWASHGSPKPLINPWLKLGHQWIEASSNSAAADMVLRGEADACVTTGSSLRTRERLVSRHEFGSPNMIFTVGTPLNQRQLQVLRSQL